MINHHNDVLIGNVVFCADNGTEEGRGGGGREGDLKITKECSGRAMRIG